MKLKHFIWFSLSLLVIIAIGAGGAGAYFYVTKNPVLSPVAQKNYEQPKPLLAYTFEALSWYNPEISQINLQGVITPEDTFTAYVFDFTTREKKVTGQINLPKDYQETKSSVVIMLRGFVDPAIYTTGMGTKNAAEVFANNGYITVAPDFLGYGESDDPDVDSFAARVKRPVTVLDLIASVKELEYVDTENIFIWAHSNGGQIALSILEITGESYPTTLWAPVTKPFPYNILYFTDEYEDGGKALRKALSIFEAQYDVQDFSIEWGLDQIVAPIQLHQGGVDDAVPLEWSDEFVELIQQENEDIQIDYYRYPSADHNLRPNWNEVVQRDLSFFRQNFVSSQ